MDIRTCQINLYITSILQTSNLSVLFCRTSRQAVDEQKKIESQLVIEVDTARSRMTQIQQELEVVVEQLGEAKVGS